MASELTGGALLAAVVSELLNAVRNAKDMFITFKPSLERLNSTLELAIHKVEEIKGIDEIDKRPEIKKLIRKLREGITLVEKCSKLQSRNWFLQNWNARKIHQLNDYLIRFIMEAAVPTRLLDVQPRELKFTSNIGLENTCSLQLVNDSYHYVAFKVKTTTPWGYVVVPNKGIVHPKSTCDITVTMPVLPGMVPDRNSNDKFLIQSTLVPFGTVKEALTDSMFHRDNGKYIQEDKLKVILISPTH